MSESVKIVKPIHTVVEFTDMIDRYHGADESLANEGTYSFINTRMFRYLDQAWRRIHLIGTIPPGAGLFTYSSLPQNCWYPVRLSLKTSTEIREIQRLPKLGSVLIRLLIFKTHKYELSIPIWMRIRQVNFLTKARTFLIPVQECWLNLNLKIWMNVTTWITN